MTAEKTAYLAIDIGASKTLAAAFSPAGELLKSTQLPTPKKYPLFVKSIAAALQDELSDYRFLVGGCAVPGRLDRKKGLGLDFGNLDWHNVPIGPDIKQAAGGAPIYIENDANLAGLSEAISHKKYRKVLYLTLSTGIGDGIIIDGKIDPDMADSEAGQMLLGYGGDVLRWEDLASGRAFKLRYGRLAKDVREPRVWREYSKLVALGLRELLPVVQPDVVIIGGSMGIHFEKFSHFLKTELAKYSSNLYDIPPVVKARRPKEAVIYGCYELAKQRS